MAATVDDAAFLASLEEAVIAVGAEALKAAGLSAERIADRARNLVVRNSDPQVAEEERRRGDRPIHEAIEVRPTDKLTFEISVESDHGLEVEFGTSRSRAQPYLRPAIEEEVGFGGSID